MQVSLLTLGLRPVRVCEQRKGREEELRNPAVPRVHEERGPRAVLDVNWFPAPWEHMQRRASPTHPVFPASAVLHFFVILVNYYPLTYSYFFQCWR